MQLLTQTFLDRKESEPSLDHSQAKKVIPTTWAENLSSSYSHIAFLILLTFRYFNIKIKDFKYHLSIGTVLIKSKSIIGQRYEQQYELGKTKHITAFHFENFF